ncbi:hypothetical protein ANN_22333 [Periplaneta americana]|uniref:Uncharacterized protein n=1 Tax=Periplaneta americana TaxID=6978 RepID=A0ABQ8S7V2_PERAM|nr:hypothetical protein ANN_22333 [Periplaneta americana]
MSPGSSTESYPAFARIGLRENPGKNLNQITCPHRDSNPGHLVSQPDALTVTPQFDHCSYGNPSRIIWPELWTESGHAGRGDTPKWAISKGQRTFVPVPQRLLETRSFENHTNRNFFKNDTALWSGRVAQLVEQLATDWKVRDSIPGGDRIFSRCQTFRTAPRFTQPPIKLSTGSFPGVKGGQSLVPTTPPHSSAEVMESMGLYLHAFMTQLPEHLDQVFPQRWIGRNRIEWPARSPDLSLLDFFLWCHLKSVMYRERLNNLEDLEHRIMEVVHDIPKAWLNHSLNGFYDRLAHCQAAEGYQFEHRI